jgi:hypothetical protein
MNEIRELALLISNHACTILLNATTRIEQCKKLPYYQYTIAQLSHYLIDILTDCTLNCIPLIYNNILRIQDLTNADPHNPTMIEIANIIKSHGDTKFLGDNSRLIEHVIQCNSIYELKSKMKMIENMLKSRFNSIGGVCLKIVELTT